MTTNTTKKDMQDQPAFDLSKLKILGAGSTAPQGKTNQALSRQEIQFLDYLASKGLTGGIA